MKLPRRRFLHLAGMATAVAVLSATISDHGAWSQATRTIKVVVPVSPGGGTDIVARLLTEQIGRGQGLTVVIENRPGASTVIGTQAVSRAAPDGNTVLITTNSFLVSPHLQKLNYDPLTSFEPICHLVRLPLVVVVNSASPYRTLAELDDAARAKPGELTLASAGPGGGPHLAVEMLMRAANVKMTYVPYPGGAAPVVNALLGGHLTSALVDYAGVAEQIKASNLRALAAGSRLRIESLPRLPTVAESGYADYEAVLWFGVFAPAKTPTETITQLADWFAAAVQAAETSSKLVAQGFFPAAICGAEFTSFIRKQFDEYGRIIREANIKAE